MELRKLLAVHRSCELDFDQRLEQVELIISKVRKIEEMSPKQKSALAKVIDFECMKDHLIDTVTEFCRRY